MGRAAHRMATCGEIFSGEWEEEEELYASLASYVAGATGDGKYEGETTKLLGQSNYYGVLDLFGSEIPSILTKLLEGQEADTTTVDGIVSVLVSLGSKVNQTEERTKYWTKLAQMVISADGSGNPVKVEGSSTRL